MVSMPTQTFIFFREIAHCCLGDKSPQKLVYKWCCIRCNCIRGNALLASSLCVILGRSFICFSCFQGSIVSGAAWHQCELNTFLLKAFQIKPFLTNVERKYLIDKYNSYKIFHTCALWRRNWRRERSKFVV